MKRSYSKIVLSTILVITLLFIQAVLPLQASADNYTNSVLNYTSPNQSTNGSNPYAFKPSDVLNPQLLTQVIGCTGVTNLLSKAAAQGIQAAENAVKNEAIQLVGSEQAKAALKQSKAAAKAATLEATGIAAAATNAIAGATYLGTGEGDYGGPYNEIINAQIQGSNVQQVNDSTTQQKVDDTKNKVVAADNAAKKQATVDDFRINCIDGIAIQLAKNQLTAMTRDTMNWVTTGFGGSPYYPRDTDSFLNSLTNYAVQKEVNYFENQPNADAGLYPWGKDYARSQVQSLRATTNPYDALKSDMSNYLHDGYTVQNFSTDFSAGGWNGWLGLTMHPQNNPLGFTEMASENLANTQARNANLTQQELLQNGGIFNQRKCVAWSKPDPSAKGKNNGFTTTVTDPTQTAGSTCTQYETVSPGSVILSKINTYVNSPELQLSLVRTMNDALNALFSALIGKFENQGLSSLGTSVALTTGANSQSFGSNELFDSNGNLIPLAGGENSGSGSDGSFDITKDLGNTYIQPVNDGSWNASTNTPQLTPGVGTIGHYYTVSASGSTNLSGSGDYWSKGDKAFFDGTSWGNGVPPYIISKKGVLQKQQDYTDMTKQYQSVVGNILPALGKLDYCIPGPNQNWENSALSKAQDIVDNQTTPEGTVYWAGVEGDLMAEYNQRIDALYGPSSPMQTATLPNGSPNPNYLAMSSAGLSMTADIPNYIDTVAQAKKDSQAILTQTNSDIAKLNSIKDQVNTIIAAAQKRRATERAQNSLPAFKQACLDSEKVTYIVNGQKK